LVGWGGVGSLVTLGVPVFNGRRHLATTLQSLLGQTYADVEVVVSDNASTDGTADIVHDVAANDDRVRYVRSDVNRGAGWNYNRVLELARGDYFKWAAADDVCAPTFVSRCVEALEGRSQAVVAFPQTMLIDASGEPAGSLDDTDLHLTQERPHQRLRQLLQHRVEWHPVFGVIRTADLRTTRGIGNFLSADITLLAELALLGEFHQVPERLFLRRYHDERSVIAHATPAEQLRWYDPSVRQRLVLHQVRLTRELFGAVRRAPLSLAERARCAQCVVRSWAIPHWRHIGGEAKIALRQIAARPRRA
jgi:glycosyltransferase involved in cell wall biosynthesis